MADILRYDPDSTPPGKVIAYLSSQDTSQYEGLPNILINPEVTLLFEVPVRYWLVEGGVVREMTAQEKADVDVLETTANVDRRRQIVRDLRDREDMALVLEALVRMLLAEDNAIRTAAGQPTRTFNQYRTAFVAQLDTLIAGLS